MNRQDMTTDATETMTGAEIVVRALKDQGVDTLFGYPGGAVLPIYDALFSNPELRHILVRHEQGAGHAAEGYARSTGKPGIALVTSGPGATNMITKQTRTKTAFNSSAPNEPLKMVSQTHSKITKILSGPLRGPHALVHVLVAAPMVPCGAPDVPKWSPRMPKWMHQASQRAATRRKKVWRQWPRSLR